MPDVPAWKVLNAAADAMVDDQWGEYRDPLTDGGSVTDWLDAKEAHAAALRDELIVGLRAMEREGWIVLDWEAEPPEPEILITTSDPTAWTAENAHSVESEDVEMWRIEFYITTGAGRMGRFEREYVEGDDEAHLRLMELEIDQTLADTSGMNWPSKRRARAWLRRRPNVPVPNTEDSEHANHVKAWRMVDGEWREAKWSLTEPDIEVHFDA